MKTIKNKETKQRVMIEQFREDTGNYDFREFCERCGESDENFYRWLCGVDDDEFQITCEEMESLIDELCEGADIDEYRVQAFNDETLQDERFFVNSKRAERYAEDICNDYTNVVVSVRDMFGKYIQSIDYTNGSKTVY